MPGSAGWECDFRTFCAASQLIGGFTPDPRLPLLTGDLWANSPAKFLRQLWEYYIDGKIPPGSRVICGFAIPYYSTDLNLAQETAEVCGITPDPTFNAFQVCGQILAWAGPPYAF